MNRRSKTDTGLLGSVLDNLFQPVKSATANKQNVGGIDLQEVLVWMLASALRRHTGHRAFDQLEQRLLDAFPRNITGDAGVVRLAADLVDLVDVHNAALRALDVVIAVLKQLLDDVFHILPDVASLGQRGGISDHEGNVQQLGQGLRQQRLARTGGADQQDVALGEFDLLLAA